MEDENKIPKEVQEAINQFMESTNLSPREEFDNLYTGANASVLKADEKGVMFFACTV
ncbi:MAG: hypothetical protein GY940_40160 [bacterium]|nr:hypothetical protein [bacterium]